MAAHNNPQRKEKGKKGERKKEKKEGEEKGEKKREKKEGEKKEREKKEREKKKREERKKGKKKPKGGGPFGFENRREQRTGRERDETRDGDQLRRRGLVFSNWTR